MRSKPSLLPARPAAIPLALVLLTVAFASAARAQGYRWRWAESNLTSFPSIGDLVPPPVIVEPSGRWVYCGPTSWQNVFATIEWDGRRARGLSTPIAPAVRWGHVTAFDAVRRRLVMFGGSELQSSTGYGDTWEWDGINWTRRAMQGPTGRLHAAVAFDPVTNRVLLFGGRAEWMAAPNGETWSWDGQTWAQLQPAMSPPARIFGQLVADPPRRRLVLFGGSDAAGLRDDTWEWDGSTWIAMGPTRRPPPSSKLAFDGTTRQVLLVHGTAQDGPVAETWLWNGRDWSLARRRSDVLRNPVAVLASDPLRQRLLCLVDTDGRPLLLRWDGTDWSPVLGGGPSASWPIGPAAPVYDQARRLVVAFEDETLHEWDGERWSYHAPLVRPSRRADAALCYDAKRQRVILFGGRLTQPLNDAYLWDGATWQSMGPNVVPPRYDHRMVYDEARDRVVLYGGFDGAGALHDTWEWDGQRWQLMASGAPMHGSQYALAYDARRQRTVFHSGPGPGETWEWDGVRWQQMQPIQQRGGVSMQGLCYHAELQLVVALVAVQPGNELWGWDGRTWSLLHVEPHAIQQWPRQLVYHASRRRLLTFRSLEGAVPSVHEWVRDELSLVQPDVLLPGTLDYRLRMARDPGRPFLVLLSSGTGPGIPFRIDPRLGIEEVPLVPDALLVMTLGLGLGGILDSTGAGIFRLSLPSIPALVGFTGYTGIVTLDASGVRSASPEVGFSLRG